MEITIEMPMVVGCSVTECAYNQDSSCHARAITIGDGIHPGCDTFLKNPSHTREKIRNAGVGACKVSGCTYNDDFECNADEVEVGHTKGKAYCMTYTAA